MYKPNTINSINYNKITAQIYYLKIKTYRLLLYYIIYYINSIFIQYTAVMQ